MARKPGFIKRGHRDPVSLNGVVIRADGRQIAVELTNLSPEGCRVECDETLRVGELINVNVPPLAMIPARVRWSLLGIAGIRLTRQWV